MSCHLAGKNPPFGSNALAFNMDMGPYYVIITGQDYDVDVSGVDLMLSMGVQIK